MTPSKQSPLRVARVALHVHDVVRVSDFYHVVVGLDIVHRDRSSASLGVGEDILLELRGDPMLPARSTRDAGLFHTAFLLPTRADLGCWIDHARRQGLRLDGSADHLVSEAVYLSDPEGNGVEIYADRPRDQWHVTNGWVEMVNNALDFEGLRTSAGNMTWQGFPTQTTIGHVHLQVGAIAPAEVFYRDVLGLGLTCRYPGASFFATGGYHHQIATNIWNSRDAGKRTEAATGLANVTMRASNQGVIDAIRDRLDTAGLNQARPLTSGSLLFDDPWGTSLSLTVNH